MNSSFAIKMMSAKLLVLFALSASCHAWAFNQKPSQPNQLPNELIIPGPAQGFSKRNVFVEQLLAQILAVQNSPITVKYFEGSLAQNRALHELQHNRTINLNWSMSTKARESKLRAIKIPIYKGMIGWRVFAIKAQEQAKYSQITELQQLKMLTAVQRHDWPDYKILKFNALPVEGQIPFAHIPKAINQGLADYFPRSVLEIEKERQWYKKENLTIENNLLLKYDAAYYFFVNKDDKSLADLIEKGFQMLINNGEFDRLFDQHFGVSLTKLNLPQRKVIDLKNPYF